jgi:hypothetical protein
MNEIGAWCSGNTMVSKTIDAGSIPAAPEKILDKSLRKDYILSMHKIIKKLDNDLFVVEVRTKNFEGYRLANQEDLNSGKTLSLFTEENYSELFGRRLTK